MKGDKRMVNLYEQRAGIEVQRWLRKIEKSDSLSQKYAKKIQKKMNEKIPEKVHEVFTSSIKNMVHATLVGAEFTTATIPLEGFSLEEREMKLQQKIKMFKKTAAVEGAGTGAGGILLGMVDFPLLLSIKMKLLFETASLYGYDVKDYRERLYILYLFQLTFSSEEKKQQVLETIKYWDDELKDQLPDKETYLQQINWKEFQLEYRDHIDFIKLLQIVPGFGAIVGAFANYHFLDALGETAKNCYRMRILNIG